MDELRPQTCSSGQGKYCLYKIPVLARESEKAVK